MEQTPTRNRQADANMVHNPIIYDQENQFAIRGNSLIAARWIGLIGQTLTILMAHYAVGFDFPVVTCMFFVIFSGIVNNYAVIKGHDRSISPTTSLAYLSFDVTHLTVLLYLTGGIGNPFYVLLLAPVLIGASLLPRTHMAILLVLSITCTLYISFFFIPLEWPANKVDQDKFRIYAESLGLGITLIFASFYAWKISEETRGMQKASFAARTALLKQKQLQALGAQAAAAVHELGSPLGTISIIAKELYKEVKDHPDIKEDVETLVGQTERCRRILGNFGSTMRGDPTYMSGPLNVKALLENIATGFLLERPEIELEINMGLCSPPPSLPQSPEITHGLGVYIQNAIQFAQDKVTIHVTCGKILEIVIEDDGPGFLPTILPRLGEPYTSSRMENGQNMGLGVFIAQTLLEETEASISYNNKISGGAQIRIAWPANKIMTIIKSLPKEKE